MFARIENDVVVEYPILNLAQHLPNVSLPADLTNDAALPEGYVYVRTTAAPEFDPATHKIVLRQTPNKVNDRWVISYDVSPLPAGEFDERRNARAQDVRAQRNAKLQESDHTQLADYPGDRAAWASYRQQLRDMPAQPGFPFNVTWPAEPNAS